MNEIVKNASSDSDVEEDENVIKRKKKSALRKKKEEESRKVSVIGSALQFVISFNFCLVFLEALANTLCG